MKDLTKMVLLFSIIFLIWIVKIFAQESSIPDYTNEQYYLMEPPMGMNAQYAWQFPDGKGDGITIVDIEFGWNWDHIDLRNNASANVGSNDNADHGTSVMGILAAEENGFGITGFVPHAQVYGIAQNFNDRDITSALDDAVSYLDQNGHPGDIILIELQVNGSYQQQNYDLMPVEFLPLGYSGINNRQAIIDAINEGYVVVEVAGNGSHNLDGILPAYYTHAIMVAGANINNGYIGGNSNYGERIDANGWALAHEIGHALGLPLHNTTGKSIMSEAPFTNSLNFFSEYDQFTAFELTPNANVFGINTRDILGRDNIDFAW